MYYRGGTGHGAIKTDGNRSQFTVIGSRLKKQNVEKNYGVLF